MRKVFIGFMVLFVAFCLLVTTAQGFSYNEYNYPWRNMCFSDNGTTTIGISFEAKANQNVIIDQIYVKTDKSNAVLTIGTSTRESGAFSTVITNVLSLNLNNFTSTETSEVQVLGSGHPEVPFWIGDEGEMLTISCEGTADVDLVVIGRKGTIQPRDPSTEKGF